MAAVVDILEREDKYKTIWHRTYAPFRRAIAGTWKKLEPTARFDLKLDSFGSFEMNCFDTGTHMNGRYTVVAHQGEHYIVVNTDDSMTWVLKIEDVDNWGLRIRWLHDGSAPIDLTRRA